MFFQVDDHLFSKLPWWLGIGTLAVCLVGCQGVAEERKNNQEQVPTSPLAPRFQTSVNCDFMLIPGTTADLVFEEGKTSHQITLSPFYCARSAVTKGMYAEFIKDAKYPYDRDRFSGEFADNTGSLNVSFVSQEQWQSLPAYYFASPFKSQIMEHLSWIEGNAFARWLSKREGRPFALISEAQARWIVGGGVATKSESFWWMATEPSNPNCWMPNPYQNNVSTTKGGFLPGSYPMNPLGIFLSVKYFWLADWFQEPYKPELNQDPIGPSKGQDGKRGLGSAMIVARSGTVPQSHYASILLVSPALPQDHREWQPPSEPEASPLSVQSLERMELPLAAGIALPMRQIPAGTFVMGRTRAERPWAFEYPPTTFHLQTYWLGETEVTQAQFRAVTGINPSRVQGDNLPVHSVTMGESLAFTELLTHQERAAGRLGLDEEYRLPTEAEWERVARAGSTTLWSCGDDPALLRRYAWFDLLGQNGPKPVATRWPNAWGFFDMEGNVLERCCHSVSLYPGGELNTHWIPLSPGHADYLSTYAARGGSFNMGAIGCETTIRRGVNIDARVSHLGFRLARGPVLPHIRKDQNEFLMIMNHDYFYAKPDFRAIMQAKGIELTPLP